MMSRFAEIRHWAGLVSPDNRSKAKDNQANDAAASLTISNINFSPAGIAHEEYWRLPDEIMAHLEVIAFISNLRAVDAAIDPPADIAHSPPVHSRHEFLDPHQSSSRCCPPA